MAALCSACMNSFLVGPNPRPTFCLQREPAVSAVCRTHLLQPPVDGDLVPLIVVKPHPGRLHLSKNTRVIGDGWLTSEGREQHVKIKVAPLVLLMACPLEELPFVVNRRHH